MIKRFNISVPKKYIKDGEEKTAWSNVGKLVKFDATDEKPEGYILELAMFPTTTFKVFEDKPKESQQAPQDNGNQETGYKEPEVEGENYSDVPF